jgi:hypothetical protein
MRFWLPLFLFAVFTAAADKINPEAREESWRDDRWSKTDVGQFVSSSIIQGDVTLPKALSIKVGDHNEASVCYDTDSATLRFAWNGPFLNFDAARYGVLYPPKIAGRISYTMPQSNLWSFASAYRGLSINGNRVILSYKVMNSGVLESPWFETNATSSALTRTFQLDGAAQPLTLTIANIPTNSHPQVRTIGGLQIALYENGGKTFAAAVRGAGVAIKVNGDHLVLIFSTHTGSQSAKLYFTTCDADGVVAFANFVVASTGAEDLTVLAKP